MKKIMLTIALTFGLGMGLAPSPQWQRPRSSRGSANLRVVPEISIYLMGSRDQRHLSAISANPHLAK